MNHERIIRRVAGTLTAASLVLGWLVHPAWLALTGFVSLNLLQSSFTGFCPLESILRRQEKRTSAGGGRSR